MNLLVFVYAAYALVSVGLIIYLARTLYTNGQAFLDEVFAENPRLARSVNHLLVVGFYLFNLGYACLMLRADPAPTPVAAIETLAAKLGALLITLALMHFGNLYLFYRIRRRARLAELPPPVLPQARLAEGVLEPGPAFAARAAARVGGRA